MRNKGDGSAWYRRTVINYHMVTDEPQLVTEWVRVSPSGKTFERWNFRFYVESIPEALQGKETARGTDVYFGKDAVSYDLTYLGRSPMSEWRWRYYANNFEAASKPALSYTLDYARKSTHKRSMGMMAEC